jgi:hypothetical protein
VNYWIYPNGNYHFYNDSQLIKSKNVLTRLKETFINSSEKFDSSTLRSDKLSFDSDSVSAKTLEKTKILVPDYSIECNENKIDLPEVKEGRVSIGLEDIRLFQLSGKTKFIASSIGYSLNKFSQMFIGDYNLENGELTNLKHVCSPNTNNNGYEKNWIPIVKKKTREEPCSPNEREYMDTEEEEELYIIYKWGPFHICDLTERNADKSRDLQECNEGELTLNIIKTYNIKNPIFNKLRGSTTFITVKSGVHSPERSAGKDQISVAGEGNLENEKEYLLGVAHHSEEHAPRHYYHYLVLLDKTTLQPLMWSNGFCFEKLGIEFCIGFTLIDDIYHFWISRHDRDPLLICISKNLLPLYPLV